MSYGGVGSLSISLNGMPWPPQPRLNAPVSMSYTRTRLESTMYISRASSSRSKKNIPPGSTSVF